MSYAFTTEFFFNSKILQFLCIVLKKELGILDSFWGCQDERWLFPVDNTWQQLLLIGSANKFHYTCQSNGKSKGGGGITEKNPKQSQTLGMINGF